MKKFFMFLSCFSSCYLSAAVYDCFTFFNELEVLRIRLEELYDVVDHFVIVEATKTFSGKPKPLYFAENATIFQKYQNKIIHIVVDDYPVTIGKPETDYWAREEHQRNAIMRALYHCRDNDVIFISDADEIMRADIPSKVNAHINSRRRGHVYDSIVALDMTLFSCKLNKKCPTRWTGSPKAIPYWGLKHITPHSLRLLHLSNHSLHTLWNAGWHFNSMLNVENAVLRWKSLSTAYYCENSDNESLGKSYGAWCDQLPAVVVDDSFPKYIRENISYFRSIDMLEDP